MSVLLQRTFKHRTDEQLVATRSKLQDQSAATHSSSSVAFYLLAFRRIPKRLSRGGFARGPTCCSGLVLQGNYTSACQLSKGQHGYPGAGLLCQKKDCLPVGSGCATDCKGCCAGLTCKDMGIYGLMCT